jgi:hypothetical protein
MKKTGLFLIAITLALSVTAQSNRMNNTPANYLLLTTRRGHNIQLYKTDGHYYLKWQQDNKWMTMKDAFFSMEEGNARYPELVAESDDYVVLRAGCGSPCWVGAFLPLKQGENAMLIHEYITFDLSSRLVAYISGFSDSISILKLPTGQMRSYYTGKCESAFTGYCIDTAFFDGNKLFYNWDSGRCNAV